MTFHNIFSTLPSEDLLMLCEAALGDKASAASYKKTMRKGKHEAAFTHPYKDIQNNSSSKR